MADHVDGLETKEKLMENIETVDRISELPDEVIHNILSFIPLKYAIRTGVLSKRWTDQWTFSHNLIIESNRDVPLEISSVDECIMNHKAKDIHTFRLRFWVAANDVRKNIIKWISFATRKHVQELIVHITCRVDGDLYGPCHFNVPLSLLSSNSIQLLDVSCCNLKLSRDFGGLSSLKTLKLAYSKINEQSLQTLLSSCPLLETLRLSDCNIEVIRLCMPNLRLKEFQVIPSGRITKIEIGAPSLQTLKFMGDVESFSLMNAPPLVSVTLAPCISRKQDPRDVIRDWVSTIENSTSCEDLTITSQLLLFLFADYAMNGRISRIIFRNLKTFLMIRTIVDTYDVSALVNFLRRCPSLERIEFNLVSTRYEDYEWLSEFLEVEQVEPTEEEELLLSDSADELSRLPHLKTVKVMHFSGKLKEMKVLTYLIWKAVNLDELILTWTYNGYTHNRRDIIAKLHQIVGRFSSRVKIEAKDIYGNVGYD